MRAEADPGRSPHFARLYELAIRDGTVALRSFVVRIGEDGVRSCIHDFIYGEKLLRLIAEREQPRKLFMIAVRNLARSQLRAKEVRVARVLEPLDESALFAGDESAQDDRRNFVMDVRKALLELSERDRLIVIGAITGESRDALAAELETSRDNVDKIVSRVHKRLRESQR
jgi:DNA-directed RNA polymerase specialized sigma24 family protein